MRVQSTLNSDCASHNENTRFSSRLYIYISLSFFSLFKIMSFGILIIEELTLQEGCVRAKQIERDFNYFKSWLCMSVLKVIACGRVNSVLRWN